MPWPALRFMRDSRKSMHSYAIGLIKYFENVIETPQSGVLFQLETKMSPL
jgi:hypothetical protein